MANKDKDIGFACSKMVIEKLNSKGFHVIVGTEMAQFSDFPAEISTTLYKDSDMALCIGGDGTFLKTAREAWPYQTPVLGINKGSMGFLAEVEIGEIEKAIEKLAEGRINIQPRMVLNVRVLRYGEPISENIAINDAVISRIALSRILNLRVLLDGKYVDSFPGDGIIISTPTGSTGYSLSAGGPIVQPDMRLMVITPICPHILYSRSFIASENKTVQVCIEGSGDIDAMLTFDGQEGIRLEPGDLVEIKVAKRDVFFASITNVNFYDVLRAKIHGKIEERPGQGGHT